MPLPQEEACPFPRESMCVTQRENCTHFTVVHVSEHQKDIPLVELVEWKYAASPHSVVLKHLPNMVNLGSQTLVKVTL